MRTRTSRACHSVPRGSPTRRHTTGVRAARLTDRQHNPKRYQRLSAAAGLTNGEKGTHPIATPRVGTDRHIFNQYVIRVGHRDQLQSALKSQGIGSEVYYPVPMHLQECFAHLGYGAGSLPESERAAEETLAIPVYPEVSDAQASYVVDCVRSFVSSHSP